MGLKLRLSWFDKKTESIVGDEISKDLGDDGNLIEDMGLSVDESVNNGGFDMQEIWIKKIKPYFRHKINISNYDYQIEFKFRKQWPEENNKQG